MRPGSARVAGDTRRDAAFVVPAAGSPGRAGMFVLAAVAGLALASGVLTGTPAAHAAVSARAAAVVHAHPMFEPCPCAEPLCRPVCNQSVVSGGPAATIHRPAHLVTSQAVAATTAIGVNCPPPSAPAPASQDGNPGC
jgi:hypothetical protein